MPKKKGCRPGQYGLIVFGAKKPLCFNSKKERDKITRQLKGNTTYSTFSNPIKRDNKWRKLDSKTWQKLTPKHDITITRSGKNEFNLDVFDAKIKDPDKAYIERDSGIFNSFKEARDEADDLTYL